MEVDGPVNQSRRTAERSQSSREICPEKRRSTATTLWEDVLRAEGGDLWVRRVFLRSRPARSRESMAYAQGGGSDFAFCLLER
jgi:hypothetical protein